MREPAHIAAVVGLFLVGLAGLFPPLKRPAEFPAGASGLLGSRSFLLSREYTFYADLGGQQVGKPGAEIDIGRLFAEVLVIASATGLCLVSVPLLSGAVRRRPLG
jgi:hypothetical protein